MDKLLKSTIEKVLATTTSADYERLLLRMDYIEQRLMNRVTNIETRLANCSHNIESITGDFIEHRKQKLGEQQHSEEPEPNSIAVDVIIDESLDASIPSSSSTMTEDKRFKCGYCEMTYDDKSLLDCHLVVHKEHLAKLYKYECKTCGKRIRIYSDFKRHLAKHSMGERFKCPHCQLEYARLHTLRYHIYKNHPGQETIPELYRK
ncbi:hypothetical protein DERF_012924 [Dermatophagoides farinae]|uniref:Zinc finger protein 37 n=1 Tax=Dermatophagoides farinae TaxID=6954 RepID=A0A922HR34_DERFA|nr:zinc finger protein 37 [Dermatophagoides farinae]KAH9502135.1 hypothetical protein DERF_012924 [Dermatophagoides farinae]